MLEALRSKLKIELSPITQKEFRSRMRSPRAYAMLTVYMSVVSGISLLIYLAASVNSANGVSDSSRVGSALFYVVAGMQIVLACFVAPSFTVGAISGEREQMTYDLLRLTPLTARQITLAKLFSALGYTTLLVLVTIPVISLALLLGGVEPLQLGAAFCVILASAFLFTTLGLFISSRLRTTLGATLVTYAVTAGIVLGMAVLALIALPILNGFLYGSSSVVKTNPFLASLLQTVQFLLVSLSPVSAVVATEANLQDSGSLFLMPVNPLPGTTTPFVLPAPFIILSVLYVLISLVLLWLTIRRMGAPERPAES